MLKKMLALLSALLVLSVCCACGSTGAGESSNGDASVSSSAGGSDDATVYLSSKEDAEVISVLTENMKNMLDSPAVMLKITDTCTTEAGVRSFDTAYTVNGSNVMMYEVRTFEDGTKSETRAWLVGGTCYYQYDDVKEYTTSSTVWVGQYGTRLGQVSSSVVSLSLFEETTLIRNQDGTFTVEGKTSQPKEILHAGAVVNTALNVTVSQMEEASFFAEFTADGELIGFRAECKAVASSNLPGEWLGAEGTSAQCLTQVEMLSTYPFEIEKPENADEFIGKD